MFRNFIIHNLIKFYLFNKLNSKIYKVTLKIYLINFNKASLECKYLILKINQQILNFCYSYEELKKSKDVGIKISEKIFGKIYMS